MEKLNKLPILAFTDIETTGLNRQKHEIIEIGLLIAKQPELKIIDTWEAKIKPLNLRAADPAALKLTGYNSKDWELALQPKAALEAFSRKTKNCILVGHNVAFDRPFLEDNFRRWNVPVRWDYHSLDTTTLAYLKLGSKQKLRLSEIAKTLKIKREKEHAAMDDAVTCYKVFKKLISKSDLW